MTQPICRFLRIVTIGSACVFFLTGSSLAASHQSPQQAVEKFLEIIDSMKFPVTAPDRHTRLVHEANAYLDVETMGSRALADHWSGIPEDQKQVFFDLLWALVETVAYPRNQNVMGEHRITYGEAVKTGDGFQVPVSIEPEDGAPAPTLSYHVSEKENRWKIDDVILDDVSIIEDLKYQFDKIIAESDFSGLLEKMRTRLADAKVNEIEKA